MYLRILFTLFITVIARVNCWCQFSRLNDVGSVSCVDYSPDGTMILTTTATRLTIWDRYTKAILFTKALTGGYCAKFSKDSPSTYIAISSASSNIQILNGVSPFASIQAYGAGHGGTDAVNIDFAPNNSLITCGGTNNKLKIWTLTVTPAVASSLDATVAQINACTYYSSTQIGTASTNNKLQLQTITSASAVTAAFSKTLSNCNQIAFSPDNLRMIAACDSGASQGIILTVASPATVTNIVTAGVMNTVAYSADGATFCYGGNSNILYIINGTSSNNTIMSQFLINSDILDSDFTNDGLHLIVGTSDGTVYQYAKYCLSCKPGYYQNLTTKTCILCDTILKGCSYCVNSTKCVQCYQNFIINPSTNTCDTCSGLMDGCGTCLNSTQCRYCMSGYYLLTPNYTCVRCQSAMVGCYICNSSSYCYQCQSDYYLDAATNQCKGCQYSVANCVKCVNSSYCTSCKIGFYENAGACTMCPTNCYACQTATNCTDCVTGYYAFSSGGTVTCTKCATGCLACNATGACKNCADDRYLDASGNCIQCPYPCLTCNATGYCLSCQAAYFFNGAGACTECSSGCVSCNSSSLCLSCSPGFYLQLSDSTCRSCQLNITFCMQCNGTTCLKCQIGYYLQSPTQCSSCITSMIACISCTSSTVCQLCAPGYYKTTTGTGNSSCQICTLGCATCFTAANCTSCHVGYYLNAIAATCTACANNCITCSSATVCRECQIGYRLGAAGACVACITDIGGCQACLYNFTATAVWCVSCQLGRYLDTATGTCPFCPANCTSCKNSTSCNTCQIGMYPDGTSTCIKCHQNCSQCVGSATNCSSCIAGYYLTGTYSCLSCSAFGCATCNSSTHDCLSCPIGFYLKTVTGPPTKICQNCLVTISNCYICTSPTICKQCSYGYALASTSLSCSPCSVIEGCKHCTNLTSCQNCQVGYYLVVNGSGFGSCTKCALGCKECNAGGVCVKCFGEYSLENVASVVSCKLCELSITGCLTCSSSAVCLTCVSGYYLDTGACYLCSTPIFACRYCNSSSICTSCQDGFYLSSNQCYKCDLASTGCTICNSSTVCLACQYGLYLSSNQCYKCINNLANCLYCLSQTQCLQCDSGYYIETGSCLSCQAHMVGCIHCNTNTSCLQCKGGYFLNSTTHICQQCKQEGCQICVQSNPLQCVKCNARFYFNSSLNTCVKCRDDISGCLECASSTVCTKCDPGYYVNSTAKCNLCESVLYGCSRCSSGLSCLQCKSTYYLYSVNNTCIDCKLPMPGCSHCIQNSSCQSCYHGYYLDPSFQCIQCTQLTGCLSCINATYCQYCQNSYFLQTSDSLCYPCNVLQGCYACTNNLTCSVCGGGYILNDQLLCEPMRVQAHQTIKDLKFVTKYFNQTCLVHYLYARDMKYNQSQNINWTKTTKLILQDSKYAQTDLTILSVQWGPNPYTLIFYTNNPLKLNQNNFPFIRRMLLSGILADQYKVNLKMDQATINQILPDFYLPKDLVMGYDIDSPQFVISYANTNSNLMLFSVFGYVVTILFIIKYIFKAVWSVPNSPEMGDIIPQVLALKAPAFMVFPTYLEFLYYCSGYMIVDFPWANQFFGDLLADKSDVVPETFALYYTNMHIGSTYFLAFIMIVVIGFIMWLVYQSKTQEQKKLNFSLGNVISNIFIFGATFASCACIQGGFLNPFQNVNMNSGFYMIGIAMYCIILAAGLYSIYHGRKNMFRIRLIIKASLLAIANLSPIYIFSVSVVLDILLIVVEYNFSRVTRLYPKLWLTKNILCNMALSILGIMPSAMISLIMTSIIITIVLLVDVFTHIKQYNETSARNKQRRRKFQPDNNQSNVDINIWNISFDPANEKYKLQDINIQQQKSRSPHQKMSQARKTGFETTHTSLVSNTKSNFSRALKKKQKKQKQEKDKPQIIDPQNPSQVQKIVFDDEQENGNTFVAHNYLG